MEFIAILVLAYLLGSIPFSHIFPKIKGKDVKSRGTKNIGATNALVVAGPLLGALALLGDIGKGFLAAYLARYFIGSDWAVALAGIAAIIGHDFSVFLKFKGGKGVATTGGALFAIDPILTLIILLLWILLIVITRYFIPSTLIMFICLPAIMWVSGKPIEIITFAALAMLIAFCAHRKDILRIISGKEINTSEAIKHYLGK